MDRTTSASFIRSIWSAPRAFFTFVAVVVGLVIIQAIFFYLQNTQVESAERAIRSLLRQEVVVSNMFLLSRSISDLQESGLIKCAVVRKSGNNLPYLDLRYRSNCSTGFMHLEGKAVTSDFLSLNGESWSVSFLASTGRFFFISLWLARVIVGLVIVTASSFYFFRLDHETLLRKRKELENALLNKLVEEKVAEITSLKIEASVQKSLAGMAQQVSHDIRSPISALNMVVKRFKGIPDDQRTLIQAAADRINDIANDLLARHKASVNPEIRGTSGMVPLRISLKKIALADLLRSIFAEKQTIWSGRPGLKLELDLTGPTEAICELDAKEFPRALSNLINNAVESIGETGNVTLALRSSLNEVAVIVSDDGRGIPENILPRLGAEKTTYGKEGTESGSGLGVLHAKSVVEAMGGKFSIQSQVGIGTLVVMSFPRTQ